MRPINKTVASACVARKPRFKNTPQRGVLRGSFHKGIDIHASIEELVPTDGTDMHAVGELVRTHYNTSHVNETGVQLQRAVQTTAPVPDRPRLPSVRIELPTFWKSSRRQFS